MSRISKQGSIVVQITTLSPEPYDLAEKINVLMKPSGEEFIASFVEANVNVTGSTEAEAVALLKETLVSRLEYLDGLPPSKLGVGPAKQLAVLRRLIQKHA